LRFESESSDLFLSHKSKYNKSNRKLIMKTKFTISMKWLIIAILILPVFSYAQTSISGNRNGAGILSQNHTGNNDAPLSREAAGVDEEDQWIHYDDTEMDDSWGFLIGGEEYDVVAKWDPEDISDYDEWVITKIKFIVVTDEPIFKVKVWEGPDVTEVYSQDVSTIIVNNWTEVTLDTPVTIDASQELWVGYYVDYTASELGGFVTATDDGPPADEYGNLYRFNGTWYSDFNNHNLQVYIESVLNADFEADPTDICFGGTVDFTNLSIGENSYAWTFEGGTPATSSEENPSVVYNTPGYYDVSLEVTSSGGDTHTSTKTEYISVFDDPAQADQPEGETDVCTNQIYTYSIAEVPYTQEYEWVLNPADAGYFTWQDTIATLETDVEWTGDFTIKVRSTNTCGDGEWSDEIECTLIAGPTIFNLEGGGSYCLGEDGVELTLDESQTGVDYELFLGGESTGIIVEGTGSEISFGLVTEEGYYEAVGSNDNCSTVMNNQVGVSVDYPPLEPSTPTGPQIVCNDETSDYTSDGSGDADSYGWVLSPEEAGTITGTELEATVVWSAEFAGTATVSLYGINECGDGNPSAELEVMVEGLAPEITGESLVCDNHFEDYGVIDHEGSTYTWEVSGGTVTDGQGTFMITVEWGEPGQGIVSVTEETANGCSGDSEEFEVTIDDCTGIDDNLENKVSVSPNPVTGNVITIRTGSVTTTRIQIINSAGAVVSEQEVNSLSAQIDISGLPKGLYFLKATYDNETQQVVKFIKR